MGLREGFRALAAGAHRRNDSNIGDLDAGRSQRRIAGERRRGQGVARGVSRIQAESGAMCSEESRGLLVGFFKKMSYIY